MIRRLIILLLIVSLFAEHYLRFQPDEIKQYFPSLIPIIDNLANIDKNMQDGNKKMGTQYSNGSKLIVLS